MKSLADALEGYVPDRYINYHAARFIDSLVGFLDDNRDRVITSPSLEQPTRVMDLDISIFVTIKPGNRPTVFLPYRVYRRLIKEGVFHETNEEAKENYHQPPKNPEEYGVSIALDPERKRKYANFNMNRFNLFSYNPELEERFAGLDLASIIGKLRPLDDL